MIRNLHFTRSLTRILATMALAIFMLTPGWGQQTFYDMSSSNYSQDFANISGWTNNYAAGTGAANWRVATSVTTSTVSNSTVFSSGASGGVQIGTLNMVILATSTNSTATDLLLNFTSRTAGSITLDYAKIANTVNASPRTSDLKIQYSIDNGATFADLTGYTIPRITNNNTAESGSLTAISLPSLLNDQSQVVIRFYVWNNGQTAGSGNRPKFSIDNIAVTSTASGSSAPPSLTAAGNATVDAPFDVTFTDDATWRGAITSITYDGAAVASGAYDKTQAGKITFTPSLSSALQTAKSNKNIVIVATGYTNATVSQTIGAGVPTINSTTAIDLALSPGSTRTITCTAKDQYSNLVSGYTFKYDATITNIDVTTTESYILDGTPRTSTTNDISVATITNASGVATFTAILPSTIDISDGISLQVQLNNGTTSIGSAFSYTQTLTQTIAAWQLNGAAGDETTITASTLNTNLNTSSLTRGSGLFVAANVNSFSANSFNTGTTTKATAITANDFIFFIVNTKTGYKVSLSTLDARFRRSSSGPNTFRWQYSTDGTNYTDLGSSDISYTATTSDGDAQTQIDISGIAGLQNVTNATTITIRLLGWGATSTGGTFGIGRSVTTGATDYSLNIGGTVASTGPAIKLSSPSQVSAGTIVPGTSNAILSNFQSAVTGGTNTVLNNLSLTTAGTYAATDMTNFKLWHNGSSNTFGSATSLGSLTSSLGIGSHSFTGLNQAVNSGTTGYFWITCDLPGTASTSKTINVAADPVLTFSVLTPTGTIAAGGVQTIQYVSSATDRFQTKQTGNWSDVNTWQSSSDGNTWINATLTPTNTANTITILNGHSVTVTTSVSADQLTINTGGKIIINGSQTLTIEDGTDATDLSVSGTVENTGTLTLTGVAVFGNGSKFVWKKNGGSFNTTNVTWGTGSTVEITGCTTAAPSNLSQAFYNLIWNCTSQTDWRDLSLTGSFSVAGDLTINSTGGDSWGINFNTTTTNRTYNIAGNFAINEGKATLATNTGIVTVNVGGNLFVASNSLNQLDFGYSVKTPNSGKYRSIINLTGNLNVGTNAIFAATGDYFGKIVFSKAGQQTFNNTGSTSWIDYSINSGSTLVLGTNMSINSSAAIDYSEIVVDGSLNCGNFIVNESSGTDSRFTLNANGTLITSNTTGINGTIIVGGVKTFSSGANYEFRGAATGTFTTSPTANTVNSLKVNNAAGVMLDQIFTITNNLEITDGKLNPNGLNSSANTMTFAGTGVSNGIWGSTNSDATYKDDNHFEPASTGHITVNTSTCIAPSLYTVTGGGSYCSGGPGVVVGLSGSESGVNYQLYNGASAVGSALAGTGSALNFGLKTAAGNYIVVATNPTTYCTSNMTGNVVIIIDPLPSEAGLISGNVTVVEGSTSIPYSVGTITNALTYNWTTTGTGWTIIGTGTSITVNFAVGASSGQLHVHGVNSCGNGTESLIDITVSGSGAPCPATTWTGAVDNNWSSPANWSDCVPGPSTNVTIPAGLSKYPTLTVAGSCNDILLQSNASSTATLLDNGNLTVNGTASVERYFSGNTTDWHLVSSPLSNATANVFYGMYLQRFTPNPVPSDVDPFPLVWYTDITSTTTPLVEMEGYGLYSTNGSSNTVTFTGKLNTGTKSHSLSHNSNNAVYGWNLLGNPFPSSIDWEAVTIPAGMTTEVHFINAATGADLSYVQGVGGAARYIPPMQGFFVSAAGAATEFSLDDAQRSHLGANSFYKSENPRMLVLQADGQNFSDQTFIHFNEQAGFEHDGVYDAYKIITASNPELPQIFSFTPANTKLSINGMPETSEVPVGFTALQSGTFTINAPKTGDFTKVLLEDLVTGIQTDLLTKSYTYNYTAGENEKRFKLHFSTTGLNETSVEHINVYSYQQTVYINLNENVKGDIFIYNIAGQQVASKLAAQGMNEIKLSNTGNYIVKVVSKESSVVRKVFIN